MGTFRRGRVWWYARTIRGVTTRCSLHTTDAFIARLRATSYERFFATREILARDPEFRRLLREHLGVGRLGWVYFILDEDARRVKIGFSRNVGQRVKHIDAHASGAVRLLRKVKGTFDDERAWHEKFSHIHVRREWFRCTDELLSAIRSA